MAISLFSSLSLCWMTPFHSLMWSEGGKDAHGSLKAYGKSRKREQGQERRDLLPNITEYHYSVSVGSLSWPGSEAGPGIDRLSPHFLFQLTPAHLVGRTNCRLKVLWPGWCSNFSLEVLLLIEDAWFRLHILHCWGHPH